MNMGQVFQAVQSWQKLAGMRMRPQVAFKVLRYTKEVGAEFELIEKQREQVIRDAASKPEGDVKLEPDSPEMNEFMHQFNELLLTESELKLFNGKLSEVMDKIGEGQDDVLSVSDLAILEPFFQEEDDGEVEEPRDIIPISGA